MNEQDRQIIDISTNQAKACTVQTLSQHAESFEFSDQFLCALYKSSHLDFQAPEGNPRDFSQRFSIIAGATQNIAGIPHLILEGRYGAASVLLRWEIEMVGRLIWFRHQDRRRYGRGGPYRALPPHWHGIYARLSEIAHLGRNREGYQEVMGLFVVLPKNDTAASFDIEHKPEWAESLIHYHIQLQSSICDEVFLLIREIQPEIEGSDWRSNANQIFTDYQKWVSAHENAIENN